MKYKQLFLAIIINLLLAGAGCSTPNIPQLFRDADLTTPPPPELDIVEVEKQVNETAQKENNFTSIEIRLNSSTEPIEPTPVEEY